MLNNGTYAITIPKLFYKFWEEHKSKTQRQVKIVIK